MISRFLALSIVIILCSKISAQENFSSFNAVTVSWNFHPKFFIYGEGQIRGIKDYSYTDYYELKGGLGYNLTKSHKPLIGFGRYVNYKNHDLSKEEFRVWLQDVLVKNFGIFKFENRFRAEQSWIYEPYKSLNSKRNRFRYRLNISVPLNSKKIEQGTVFANAYDEIFFVTPAKPIFARNRFFGGFGYQIDENFGLATGYLWQREFEAKGNRNLHFLYLALNINIDTSKQEGLEIYVPSAD